MNESKKTLLVLTPGFAKDENDSTCLPFQQVFLRAVQKIYPGIDITVISFQYPFSKGSYQWNGIDVISFGGQNKGGIRRRLLWWKLRKRARLIIKSKKVSAILSFWCGEAALIGKQLADKYRIRHLCWIAGQDAGPGNKFVGKIRPTPNELVAVSDFIQNEFEKNYEIRPANVVAHGIERELFQVAPKERDIHIVGAGSLITLKRYDLFVRIVGKAKTMIPNVTAVIAGNGPQFKELQSQIEELGLTENIKLVGELPHHNVLALMQRSRLFLHPSSFEGFGVVCIEALYAGCNVISFYQPMNFQTRNWWIAGNEKEMVDRAIDLLRNNKPSESVFFKSSAETAREMIDLLFD